MKSIGILKPPSLSAIKQCTGGDRFLARDKDISIGEVYTAEIKIDASLKLLSNFFQTLTDNGYIKRDGSPYNSLSLTYCKGSIQPHHDPDYGLVALWLVSVKRLHQNQHGFQSEDPVLYSSKQWLDVRLGEIIVFDTDKEHAWLSNYHCSMIMQTVRRVRRTRRVESN